MAHLESRYGLPRRYLRFVFAVALRVLTGPLAGATFDMGPRLVLGRISACDVHLLDAEVSREHAMVVREGDTLVLVDLDSSNGTLMGGERVTRRVLEIGDQFSIGGSEFVLQRQSRCAEVDRSTAVVRALGLDYIELFLSTRSTIHTRASPRVEAVVASHGDGPCDSTEFEECDTGRFAVLASDDVDFAVSFGDTTLEHEDTRQYLEHTPEFSTPIGLPTSDYEGDLLADVTCYRTHRLRMLRGEVPRGPDALEVIALEASLRGVLPDGDEGIDLACEGFFSRFGFVTPARIRVKAQDGENRREFSGMTVDLSVDGVCCKLDERSVMPKIDDFAVLFIDGVRDGMPVVYTFTSRVVWVRNRDFGFLFGGAPGWYQRSANVEHMETIIRTPKVS